MNSITIGEENNRFLTGRLRAALDTHFGPSYQDAIEAVLHDVAVFPEQVKPEPFRTKGFAGTGVRVSRDWTHSGPLPYVTIQLDASENFVSGPSYLLASLSLGEARKLAEYILANAE